MLFLWDGRQCRYRGSLSDQSTKSWKKDMQGPTEESPLHKQASGFIPNRKVTEDSYQPDLSRGLSIDLPAYYDLDKKYTTSSSEIWSYYLYLVANSGASLLYFAPIAFQSLLARAAGEEGVLRFAGRLVNHTHAYEYTIETGCSVRTVNSIVLLSNGIAFVIQTVLFILLGSCAGGDTKWYFKYRN